jgi:1,4-dihydroxy-2-naphthoate octaprenyltransferase
MLQEIPISATAIEPVAAVLFSNNNFGAGFCRLADPKISLASMSSIFLGACAAAAAGPIHVGWLVVTIAGIFAIEVAKNASGEIFDFDSGADLGVAAQDRTPFSGGKRVLVDGVLTRGQTKWIAAIAYIIGCAAGITIVFWREPSVLFTGVVGVACAFFYHAPPLKLSYRGLGELAVGVCYGPLICLGTFVVQRQAIAATPFFISIPLGLLIANFLLINEFPDAAADCTAGKRTLVVQLGKRNARHLFVALFVFAFVIVLLLTAVTFPRTILLATIAVVPAALAALRLGRNPGETTRNIAAQAQTLTAFVLYSLGAGIGLLLAH